MIKQYFDLNLWPLFLIGIVLFVVGVFPLLMRFKSIYCVFVEYVHSIQLVGLTYFVIYPFNSQLPLYSFVKGFDYANFSFMYNIAQSLIPPSISYVSLTGYAFTFGDMNWLRLSGAMLLCLAIALLFCVVVYAFRCSRGYAPYFLGLIVDLMLVKALHSWFASLVYSGLNIRNFKLSFDFFTIGSHLLSYVLLAALFLIGFTFQEEYKFPNVFQIFLLLFVSLLSVLSVAPTLICSELIFLSFVEFGVAYALQIHEESANQ